MNTYKITNITDKLGKRDANFNMIIDIEYIENRVKKIFKLKAGDNMFITVPSALPLSIHRLRLKKLIMVSETNNIETNKPSENKPKIKKTVTIKKNVKKEVITDEPKKISTRKKNYKN